MSLPPSSVAANCVKPSLPDGCLKFLEWDSHHFGLPVARLLPDRPTESELGELLEQARQAGIGLVYWTTPVEEWAGHPLLERYGGRAVGHRATFVSPLSPLTREDAGDKAVVIREYPKGAASDALLALAVEAGAYSRFRLDPRIPTERFEALYRLWVQRSTLREIAGTVLIAESPAGELLGFVTIAQEENAGVIGLIAVARAAQGQGVGTNLMEAARSWMLARSLTTARVCTQRENEAACRLYCRTGFEPASVETDYHFWMTHDGG